MTKELSTKLPWTFVTFLHTFLGRSYVSELTADPLGKSN